MPQERTKKSAKLGFTLVETICALALLTVVFAGFVTLVASSAKLNTQALKLGTAFDTAAASLELGSEVETTSETLTLTVGDRDFDLAVELRTTKGDYPLSAFSPEGG